MSLRWRGAPPTPPPRDPAGINSIVQQHHRSSNNNSVRSSRSNLFDAEEDMSSDSSSPPRPDPQHKRRSSYENVDDHCPNKPPPGVLSGPRRSTPSPRPHHVRSSPCPSVHSRHTSPAGPRSQSVDHWSEPTLSDEGEQVRRRPASACRAPRTHRGSMPPVDCLGTPWMHRGSYSPCCAPSPMPYHWCGPPQSWAHYATHPANDSIYESDDLQHKIYQLELEKEQLTLQVNVLSEQVEAQNEKISELENSLLQNKEQLSSSEALLRQEMSSRSSMENIKLDLMSQISALRLRMVAVEKEKHEIEERNCRLENELILTCASLAEKEADLNYLQSSSKSRLSQGTANELNSSEGEYLEKLKEALKAVIAANDEKERKIQELKLSLNRYKKLQELVLSSHKAVDGLKKYSMDESFHSTTDSITPFHLEGIDELGLDFNLSEKPPPVPRQMQHSLGTFSEDFHRSSSRLGELSRHSPFSPIRGESPSPFSSLNTHRYNSSENVSPPTPQKTPPAKRHYSTLPRPHANEIIQQYIKSPLESPQANMRSGPTSQSFHNLHHPSYEAFRPVRTKASSGLSFGKGFFKLKLGKRSCSAPELAPEHSKVIQETPKHEETNYQRTSSPLTTLPPKEKSKGFKKIFGKVKRTGSENLNQTEAEFKRGGIRATAGPRLGWSNTISNGSFKVDKPFAEWDSSMICDWFFCLGLGMYVPECKKWVKNGEQLLKATMHDFEKEIGIKNPLHRKKLLLAVSGAKEQAGDIVEPAGRLDHQWVVRWLDDIGLPQYKDAFFDARIDGRMLHHLTLEDLSHLKVTNLLHHISIKTSIQVLRENNFDEHCLKRRSLPDDENTPSDVSRWTNHRVMEWLRTVDLSEYAPNLRGSGVHGGLMLYEPRFNADLLATLLNIPPSKTLLRRHLSTQFKQLIGPETMQKKREWEAQPNYSPLSPSAKVKPVKKSHFSLMKKKHKNELAFEDYVCPLNFGSSTLSNGHNSSEEEKFLMKEMVIKNEKILESMPTSNV